MARAVRAEAVCPDCGTVSGRVHGSYRRRLTDLAVAGRKSVVTLLVRRFMCSATGCSQRTFVGQRRARRAVRARTPALERIALALTGRPAARPAAHLAIPVSANLLPEGH
ncbi:transposase family protein [Streptomyces sp. NPDC059928]|uniref:transposase family protein n=1 Tax=unclassified Streptomyces TaxID=2593676 RepID=UPI0036611305